MSQFRFRFRPHRLRGRFASPVGLTLAGLALGACLTMPRAHAGEEGAAPTPAARRGAGVLTSPLVVDWKYTTAAFTNNNAAPVVDDTTAYFASGSRVYAVDLQSGALKWKYPATGNMPSSVLATPVIAGDGLYFGTGDGIYSLNIADGKPKYTPYKLRSGVAAAPVVVGDGIYFGAEGRIYALSSKTGEPLSAVWRQGIDSGSELAGDIATSGNMLFYVTTDRTVHAIDAGTGSTRWAQRVLDDARKSTPVAAGENLYVPLGRTLYNFRIATGTPRWQRALPGDASASPGVDADGNAYLVAERSLYALNSQNKPLWNIAPKLDYDIAAQPVVSGDLLILGTLGGGVYAFDRNTGGLKWNYALRPTGLDPYTVPLTAKATTRPVLAGDTLFVLTDDGTLTSFRHDAADLLPPTVTRFDPEQGEYLNARPSLHIGAKVIDDGSGLNLSTLSLKLDDTPLVRRSLGDDLNEKPGYTFNADSGLLDYTIQETDTGKSNVLRDGHHTVTLSVRDWAGNTATKSWMFTVDETLPRRRRGQNGVNGGIGRFGGGSGRPGSGGAGGSGSKGGGGGGD